MSAALDPAHKAGVSVHSSALIRGYLAIGPLRQAVGGLGEETVAELMRTASSPAPGPTAASASQTNPAADRAVVTRLARM